MRTFYTFIVAICWSVHSLNATDLIVPTEFYLVGVDAKTGALLWEAYSRDEVPDQHRDQVPADFFDRDFSRSYYHGWENREETKFRVAIESDGIGRPSDGFAMQLTNAESREFIGSAKIDSYHLIRSHGDRLYVIDNAGILFCFRLAEFIGDDWKPEWTKDLIPDRSQFENPDLPLETHVSDLRFEGDSSLWVLTVEGLRNFDHDGNQLQHLATDEIDLRKKSSYVDPGSNVEIRITQDSILVRANTHFHGIPKDANAERWSYFHGFNGFQARYLLPDDRDVWILEALDPAPRSLRWAMGIPNHAHSHLKRTEKTVLTGLKISQEAGLGYNRRWLQDRLSEDWIEETKGPAPIPDPLKVRRQYQQLIDPSWEPKMAKLINEEWAQVQDFEKLDRCCVRLLTDRENESNIDREFVMFLLYERIYGVPNRSHLNSDSILVPSTCATSFLPDQQDKLLTELRRILQDGPPGEQFSAATLLAAPTWNEDTTADLMALIEHPSEDAWKWGFYSLFHRDAAEQAFEAVKRRSAEDQADALLMIVANRWAPRTPDQISETELALWKEVFAKAPLELARALRYTDTNYHLADDLRDFLSEEAAAKQLTDYPEHRGLGDLILTLNSLSDPQDTAILTKFAEHPQKRLSADGSGDEFWIQKLVAPILKARGVGD
ncbi:MAG: hypothetical protein AAF585_17285 [Verrucomicrobiota bacterium]